MNVGLNENEILYFMEFEILFLIHPTRILHHLPLAPIWFGSLEKYECVGFFEFHLINCMLVMFYLQLANFLSFIQTHPYSFASEPCLE